MNRIVATGVALLACISRARADVPPSASPLHLGECQIASDVKKPEQLTFDLCLKARAGAELGAYLGKAEENVWLRYARGYAGAHFTEYVSLHASGYARDVKTLRRKQRETPAELARREEVEQREIEPDYAVVRFGNPAVHRYRLEVGRMRLPFGLDASEAMELLRALENREMWASPRFGVAYTADNLNTTTIEAAVGTDRWRKPEEGESDLGTKKNPQDAVSTRIAYDMPMLDGSRLVFSGYGERHGERRFGIGFLTTTAYGDTTHAEFVRKMATPVGNTEPFKQLLRLSYASNWRGNGRWVVLIDDERFRHRLGSVEYDARFLEHLKLKVSIAYMKSETGDDMRRWSLATGLEAFL